MPYVVYCIEYLRDGEEESAKIEPTLDAALKTIDRCANGFFGPNCKFKLFELGKEIPIELESVEEPQPAKTKAKAKYKVKS